jgi:hypothetical protein
MMIANWVTHTYHQNLGLKNSSRKLEESYLNRKLENAGNGKLSESLAVKMPTEDLHLHDHVRCIHNLEFKL